MPYYSTKPNYPLLPYFTTITHIISKESYQEQRRKVRVTYQRTNLSFYKQPNPKKVKEESRKELYGEKTISNNGYFPMVYCSFTPLDIAQFLLSFERNKIRKQKIKSYYSLQVSKKFQHRRDNLISIGQPHKLSTKRNMKQTCKEEYLHTKIL